MSNANRLWKGSCTQDELCLRAMLDREADLLQLRALSRKGLVMTACGLEGQIQVFAVPQDPPWATRKQQYMLLASLQGSPRKQQISVDLSPCTALCKMLHCEQQCML